MYWAEIPYFPVYNARPCIIRTLGFDYFLKKKKIQNQNQWFNLRNFFIDLFVTRTWNSPRHLQQFKLTICFFTAVIARNTYFKNLDVTYNWRLRWKKGGRFFTWNWTLSETLQISHVVLIRYVKECSVCFLVEVCLVFEILRMQKTCILWSRQHVTAKTVISLKIKQNIDPLQRATLKSVHFR